MNGFVGGRGKGLFGLLDYTNPSLRKRHSIDLSRKPGNRYWSRNLVYWLGPHSFLNLLFVEPRTACPGIAPSTVAWILPQQSLIKSRPAYRSILWWNFPNISFSQVVLAYVKLTNSSSSSNNKECSQSTHSVLSFPSHWSSHFRAASIN